MTRYKLTDDDYRRLLSFRTGLRKFLKWSEQRALLVGLTSAQHQLLLAIKGHDNPDGPTIGELADYLLSRQHSVGGLVQRALEAGLVERFEDPDDRRVSRIKLAVHGEETLEQLSALHLEELSRLVNELSGLWKGLEFPFELNHGRMPPEVEDA